MQTPLAGSTRSPRTNSVVPEMNWELTGKALCTSAELRDLEEG
jgi:hypothetical protein